MQSVNQRKAQVLRNFDKRNLEKMLGLRPTITKSAPELIRISERYKKR